MGICRLNVPYILYTNMYKAFRFQSLVVCLWYFDQTEAKAWCAMSYGSGQSFHRYRSFIFCTEPTLSNLWSILRVNMILADHISPVRLILFCLCPCKRERGTVFQAHLLINRLMLLWIIHSMETGIFTIAIQVLVMKNSLNTNQWANACLGATARICFDLVSRQRLPLLIMQQIDFLFQVKRSPKWGQPQGH